MPYKRRSNYARFGRKAARNIMAAARSRRGLAGGSIRQGFISANRTVHKMALATTFQGSWNPDSGIDIGTLGGAGFNPVIAVTPNGCVISNNNSAWLLHNWQNASSLAAIFQEIRITAWSVEMHYSANAAAPGTVTTTPPSNPIVYSLIDREDALGVLTTNSAVQYASMKVYDALRDRSHSTTDDQPTVTVGLDNTNTFIGTIEASGRRISPWISLGTNSGTATPPDIPHGNIKYWFDAGAVAPGVVVGNFTFIVRCLAQYRGID